MVSSELRSNCDGGCALLDGSRRALADAASKDSSGMRRKVTYRTGGLRPSLGWEDGRVIASVLQQTRGERDCQLCRLFRLSKKGRRQGGSTDAEAGVPLAEASGAICVQRLDDSRNSAIHIKYRISLRSSSLREPRYPLLRVVHSVVRRPITRNTGFSFSSKGQ